MKNSTNLGQNSLNSNANFWAKLKALFALPKWAKIFLGVLSVVAVAGLLGTFALQSWADDKVETANLTFTSANLNKNKKPKLYGNPFITPDGKKVINLTYKDSDIDKQENLKDNFTCNARVHFPRFDFLLRSKVIAYIDIVSISWDNTIKVNEISELKSQNRHLNFSTSQNLQDLNIKNLGTIQYKMDFSPLLKTIVKHYLILVILVFLFFSKFLWYITTTQNKIVQILLAIIAFIAMSASFYNNVFGIVDKGWFEHFQLDDQSMIISKIVADKNGLDTQGYGMGFIQAQGYKHTFGIQSNEILEKGIVPQSFSPYTSTPGIQGYVWSFIYSIFDNIELKNSQTHLKNLKPLNLICSFLSALVILILSFLLGKIFGKLFGVVFLFSMFLSPWVTNFAHHTFYNLFLWLTPSIFGFWIFLYLQNNTYKIHKKAIFLLAFAYFASMFIVSLTHYHYLTSVVLFSLAPFLLTPFLRQTNLCNPKISTKIALKFFVALFVLAVLSTLIVLVIHGFIRGSGDLLEGLKIMYEKDFLRRMVGGSAENFVIDYAPSLNANIFEVILKYLNWSSPIIVGLDFKGNFYVLLIVNILLLFFTFKGTQRKLLIAMFSVFALPALSWFIFGKAQSYIHTHINFILWYFGFIAVLLYVPILALVQRYNTSKGLTK